MASTEDLANTPAFERILNRVAGEHGADVVKILMEQGEATDEEIANETGIRLNLVRKILYDLYDNRVLDYRRSRDEDTGWYVYYWHVEPSEALELVNENKRKLLEKLRERIEHERSTMFFKCGDDCPRIEFGEAVENDFECPSCGETMEEFDNSGIINALERQIETLERELAES
ncbi:MAG: transcription factor E [Candidatus Hadarchaeia archaeon]